MSEAPKPQVEKFRDLARQLEADEDEARFEDQVRRIARNGDPAETGPPQSQD